MASHHQSSFVVGWFPPHNEGKGSTPDSNMEKIKAAYKKAFGTTGGMEPGFDNLDDKTRLAICQDNRAQSREIDSTGEWVYEYPEKSDGTKLDMKLFNTILDSYYKHRGWDKTTGRPTRAKLEELRLKEVAKELVRLDKLSKM